MHVRAAIFSVLALGVATSCLGPRGANQVGAKVTSTAPSDLAREVQNPVSLVRSLAITGGAQLDIEPTGDPGTMINLRSSFPMRIEDEFNAVNIIDVPFLSLPPNDPTGQTPGLSDEQVRGIGDVRWTSYITLNQPSDQRRVFGGVGAVVAAPTASEAELGTGRWGLGPAATVVRHDGPFVWGGSVSNTWAVFSSSSPNFSQLLLEPFIHLNFGSGWYLTTQPVIIANWGVNIGQEDQWIVPVGGGLGRVFYFAEAPLNTSFQVYKNVESPIGGAEWQILFELQLIFPYTKL